MTSKILDRLYADANDIFNANRPSCRCWLTMPRGQHDASCPEHPEATVKNPVLHYPTED